MSIIIGAKRTLYCNNNIDNLTKWLSDLTNIKNITINNVLSSSLSSSAITDISSVLKTHAEDKEITELIEKHKINNFLFKLNYKNLNLIFSIDFKRKEVLCTYPNEDTKTFDSIKDLIFPVSEKSELKKVKRMRKK